MVAKVTWGHGVLNAVCAPYGGRLLVTGSGVSGWGWDDKVGYPNWGYTQNSVTYSEEFTRDAIAWLTNKATGMDILIFANLASSGPFGPLGFQGFVTRTGTATINFVRGTWSGGPGLEGNLTITGSNPGSFTWTLNQWKDTGGTIWDPNNYDLVIFPYSPSASYHYDGIDAYLQAGGAVWGIQGTTGTAWQRYGIENSGIQSGGPPDYLCPAFSCAALGPDSYRYGVYTTAALLEGTNTMGGSLYLDDPIALWSQF